jgi:tRNA A-37 threonylcarbamoyl transferase component Bud32
LGEDYVMKWIANIAIGIAELEELGIYHADLALRNTIRVTLGERSVFKIIDFDYAFKVMRTEEKDKAFDCANRLLDFWLKSNFHQNEMRPQIEICP